MRYILSISLLIFLVGTACRKTGSKSVSPSSSESSKELRFKFVELLPSGGRTADSTILKVFTRNLVARGAVADDAGIRLCAVLLSDEELDSRGGMGWNILALIYGGGYFVA